MAGTIVKTLFISLCFSLFPTGSCPIGKGIMRTLKECLELACLPAYSWHAAHSWHANFPAKIYWHHDDYALPSGCCFFNNKKAVSVFPWILRVLPRSCFVLHYLAKTGLAFGPCCTSVSVPSVWRCQDRLRRRQTLHQHPCNTGTTFKSDWVFRGKSTFPLEQNSKIWKMLHSHS